MAETFELINGILVLDVFDNKSELLYKSFRKAGFMGPVLVIEDDGFLPPDVIGMYQYFLGEKQDGKPLYFNQISIPDFWEIKSTNQEGKIYDMVYLRGKIQYTKHLKNQNRIVSRVDFNNRKSVVRLSEGFDSTGRLYKRYAYDRSGKPFNVSYFDMDDREVIVENCITHDIILNLHNQVYMFHSKPEFAAFVMDDIQKKLGISFGSIFYNSLSTPLVLSIDYHKGEDRDDVLIWQEDERDEVPGNMKLIFGGYSRTKKVLVQNKKSLDALLRNGADATYLGHIGFVYDFLRENGQGSDVLICTNSDQVEGLKEVLEGCKNLTFHIVALTEMSSKLLSFGKYENCILYPGVGMKTVEELFEKCDYYLDINHYDEILNSLQNAFLNNMFILSLEETLHSKLYVSEKYTYKNVHGLVSELEKVSKDRDALDKALKEQRVHAMNESSDCFREALMKSSCVRR